MSRACRVDHRLERDRQRPVGAPGCVVTELGRRLGWSALMAGVDPGQNVDAGRAGFQVAVRDGLQSGVAEGSRKLPPRPRSPARGPGIERGRWKGSADVDTMTASAKAMYARMWGATLARAHARSGDRIAIASYPGNGDVFDRPSPTSPPHTPTRTNATTKPFATPSSPATSPPRPASESEAHSIANARHLAPGRRELRPPKGRPPGPGSTASQWAECSTVGGRTARADRLSPWLCADRGRPKCLPQERPAAV